LNVSVWVVDAISELNPSYCEAEIVIPDSLCRCFCRPRFRFFGVLSVFRRDSPALAVVPQWTSPLNRVSQRGHAGIGSD
jgi:hypothetical protein